MEMSDRPELLDIATSFRVIDMLPHAEPEEARDWIGAKGARSSPVRVLAQHGR